RPHQERALLNACALRDRPDAAPQNVWATTSRSEELREHSTQVVRDVDGRQAITLDLEREIARVAVRERAKARSVVRRHPFRHQAGDDAAKDVASPSDRHARIPGVVELDAGPIRYDVHVPLQEDHDATRLYRV